MSTSQYPVRKRLPKKGSGMARKLTEALLKRSDEPSKHTEEPVEVVDSSDDEVVQCSKSAVRINDQNEQELETIEHPRVNKVTVYPISFTEDDYNEKITDKDTDRGCFSKDDMRSSNIKTIESSGNSSLQDSGIYENPDASVSAGTRTSESQGEILDVSTCSGGSDVNANKSDNTQMETEQITPVEKVAIIMDSDAERVAHDTDTVTGEDVSCKKTASRILNEENSTKVNDVYTGATLDSSDMETSNGKVRKVNKVTVEALEFSSDVNMEEYGKSGAPDGTTETVSEEEEVILIDLDISTSEVGDPANGSEDYDGPGGTMEIATQSKSMENLQEENLDTNMQQPKVDKELSEETEDGQSDKVKDKSSDDLGNSTISVSYDLCVETDSDLETKGSAPLLDGNTEPNDQQVEEVNKDPCDETSLITGTVEIAMQTKGVEHDSQADRDTNVLQSELQADNEKYSLDESRRNAATNETVMQVNIGENGSENYGDVNALQPELKVDNDKDLCSEASTSTEVSKTVKQSNGAENTSNTTAIEAAKTVKQSNGTENTSNTTATEVSKTVKQSNGTENTSDTTAIEAAKTVEQSNDAENTFNMTTLPTERYVDENDCNTSGATAAQFEGDECSDTQQSEEKYESLDPCEKPDISGKMDENCMEVQVSEIPKEKDGETEMQKAERNVNSDASESDEDVCLSKKNAHNIENIKMAQKCTDTLKNNELFNTCRDKGQVETFVNASDGKIPERMVPNIPEHMVSDAKLAVMQMHPKAHVAHCKTSAETKELGDAYSNNSTHILHGKTTTPTNGNTSNDNMQGKSQPCTPHVSTGKLSTEIKGLSNNNTVHSNDIACVQLKKRVADSIPGQRTKKLCVNNRPEKPHGGAAGFTGAKAGNVRDKLSSLIFNVTK